jgi:hypothetical protein
MDVRVLEPGHDEAALELDDLRVGPDVRLGVLIRPTNTMRPPRMATASAQLRLASTV